MKIHEYQGKEIFKKYQINENLHQKIFIYCKKKKLNGESFNFSNNFF